LETLILDGSQCIPIFKRGIQKLKASLTE